MVMFVRFKSNVIYLSRSQGLQYVLLPMVRNKLNK